MADRVYPSSKPTTIHPPVQAMNGTTTGPPTFPATKSQLYGASRPAYRPTPKRQRSRRSCCCSCFLWSTIILIAIILLAAIAGGVIYVLYRPHRPSFSLQTLRISQFNVTQTKDSSSTSHLNSKLDIIISAKNPNKKLIFFYDPITVNVKSKGIDVGSGNFPSFVHGTKNSTSMKARVGSSNGDLDSSSASELKADLKKKNGFPLEIELETKVKVKMGGMKSKRVGIRVICNGIQALIPKGKSSSSSSSALASSSDPKCKVNLRIKIWKWTF